MTTERSRLTDYDIERFLRGRSAEPDAGLWSDIMAATTERQRTRFWKRWTARRRVLALVVIGLLMVAIAGTVAVGTSLIRPAPPVPPASRVDAFVRPFSFVVPTDSSLELVREDWTIHRFEGAGRGVAVFGIRHGNWVHDDCGRRGDGRVSGTPAEILHDLRVAGSLHIGAATPGELDGRPALISDVAESPEECVTPDIHLSNVSQALDYVPLNMPARLILADVDDVVIAVQIWTERPEDLAAWIPTAMELVETFHFSPRPTSSP